MQNKFDDLEVEVEEADIREVTESATVEIVMIGMVTCKSWAAKGAGGSHPPVDHR